MKNSRTIISGILLTIVLTVALIVPSLALAQPKNAPTAKDKATTSKIDELFKIQEIKVKDKAGNDVEANQQIKGLSEQIGSKKESSFADVFGSIIKIMSGIAVVMTFVGAIVAGVMYLFSEGEEGKTTKARSIMIYIIIGDLIIAASYLIVSGITSIKPLP